MAEPLLPIRHPNADFFICDLGDVIPKSDIASMEHPLFTLSTKPDTAIRHYENNGNSVTITPSVLGLATIHDKDILIFCISQLMAGINKGKVPGKNIAFRAHDLLVTTNRQTGGEAYARLTQSFERLSGTRIQTNIKTNEQAIVRGFGLIESYEIIYDNPETKNRMISIEVTISDWLYNSVIGKEVLSINRAYFRLRKPIERRIYEIARKHCGNQERWHIGIENLHKKVGSSGAIKKFRESLSHIIKHGHLPDYVVSIESGNVVFSYVGKQEAIGSDDHIFLKPDTIEKAKKILGSQCDVYAIEAEWLEFWKSSGRPELKTPDGAFINFCKTKTGRNQPSTTK